MDYKQSDRCTVMYIFEQRTYQLDELITLLKTNYNQRRYDYVEAILSVLFDATPGNAQVLHWLYNYYNGVRKFDTLLSYLQQVLDNEPSHQQANYYKVTCCRNLKRHRDALHALALVAPGPISAQQLALLKIKLLKECGDQADALQAIDSLLKIDACHGEAFWLRRDLLEVCDADLNTMQDYFVSCTDKDDKAYCGFAIAYALDKTKQYRLAFDYYSTSAQLKRQLVDYNHQKEIDDVKNLITAFSKQIHSQETVSHSTPIFIVGMPRSGTTLVEQIIAAHSMVTGADELSDLALATTNVLQEVKPKQTFPFWADELSLADYKALGEVYLSLTKQYHKTPYFTDKMPLNYKAIGIIKRALPHAKIIHCVRNPMDTIWGCYKQIFGDGIGFSYDLKELTETYNAYRNVMAHWHRLYPGEIYDVHYEQLVTNQYPQTKQLLAYLGLDFEQQCFDFHTSERVVHTLSNQQVRQPIYSGAVAGWENYQFALNEYANQIVK